MSKHPRALLALAAVALTSTGLLAVPSAYADTTPPPWQPPAAGADANNVGTLAFYDATGAQITTGSTLTSLGSYVGTTGLTPLSGNSKAVLYAYTPNASQAPGAWSGAALTGATTWPNAGAPAPLNTSTDPLVTESSDDTTLDDYGTNSYPNISSTTGYVNVYELRVFDTGTSGFDVKYASADVVVDSVAHTWTQQYPGLRITSPPGTPQGVTATAGNAQATVSWTAPSNGGDPITKYTVSYTPTGGSVTTKDVSGTGTVLSPLVNGATYTVTVTATNTKGTGEASTPATVTPKYATTLGLASTTPARITGGTILYAKGTLSGGSVSSQTIALTIYASGHGHRVVNVTTDVHGVFSYGFHPVYNTTVGARFGGTASQNPSTAANKSTLVNTLVKIASPKSGTRTATRTWRVTGTTTPNKAGSVVVLYERRGTSYVKLAAVKVASNGTFAFTRTFAKGTHVLQVRIGTTSTNSAGNSALSTLVEV